MKKISAVLAGVIIVGSIASTAAFAAMPSPIAVRQSQIVNQCRNMEAPEPRQHQRLAVDACIQRLDHVNQAY